MDELIEYETTTITITITKCKERAIEIENEIYLVVFCFLFLYKHTHDSIVIAKFRYSKSFFFKLNNDGLITGIYIFVFDLSAMTDRSLPYASANKMSSLYISVMVVVNGAVFFLHLI